MFKRISCWCYFSTIPRISKTRVIFATKKLIRAYSVNRNELSTEDFPPERIRNFSIIAHIDHGKSTLADRLLERTGTVAVSDNNRQILDKLQVERERGITVKAQTASMVFEHNGIKYLINLIDTPGHVDFSYEVARSLHACQGVVLLVDANQGVQAQTVANFYLAFARNLPIIPVVNKIDLKNANPAMVIDQLGALFEIEESTVLKASAKTGIGVDEILQAVVERIPPPNGNVNLPTRALLFDSWYDQYKGVALLVALRDGTLRVGQEVSLAHAKKTFDVKEVGLLRPNMTPTNTLYAGQVGYVYCNIKNMKDAAIGETLFETARPVEALPGFAKAKPMVYAGVYPMDQSENVQLRKSLDKLLLNDPSVSSAIESSPALGLGWRLGFLGVLHMEVFNQRLEQEFSTEIVLTAPSVPFKVKIKGPKNIKAMGEYIMVHNPEKLPDESMIEEIYEPMVIGTIICPMVYVNDITSLCISCRGRQIDSKNIDADRIIMTFHFPLCEIVLDFYDRLKSVSSGYASFDYEDADYQVSPMTKVTFFLNGELVEEMSTICHKSMAREVGRHVCEKLKETVPRQQFLVAVQAKVGGTVIARENIKAFRKDITGKLKFGGDVGRKNKLLKIQAEGKKRMRVVANIQLPRETFVKVLQRK